MDSSLRKISFFTAVVIAAMIPAYIFGYERYHDLLGIKARNHALKRDNSRKGLELFEQIDLLKRLKANNLELIEHIARTELGLVREDEQVFVYESVAGANTAANNSSGFSPAFRFLTEDEFEELLQIDLKSLDFYEELSEREKQAQP